MSPTTTLRRRPAGPTGDPLRPLAWLGAALALLAALPGCESLGGGSLGGGYCVDAVPARRLPPTLLGRPKADQIEISKARLRQMPPEVYELGPGDVLGVYVETILGNEEDVPPVNFPEDASLPPSIGFPIPVRDDGTISLPLVMPVEVAGLTIGQAEQRIREAYIPDFLANEDAKIIVTVLRQREYRVIVIREEAGGVVQTGPRGGGGDSGLKRGTGSVVDLKAYENDLLHALAATGGLPGLDAKNEVLIYRGGSNGSAERDAMVAAFMAGNAGIPRECRLPPPPDPDAIRIPLRYYPENPPQFTEEDIILNSGDIVLIQARDSEKYYTGGTLGGGEFLLPRDYDLNILQAIAVAGGGVGQSATGIGSIANRGGGLGGNRAGGPCGPSRALVVRQVPGCGEIVIRVDLNRALTDPRERILVQPEDVIIVQYTLPEEIANATLGLLPFYLIGNGLR